MIKEYTTFIKEYLKISQTKKSYLLTMMITAFLYKGSYLLLPFIFNLSIKENLNLVDSNHDNQIASCKKVGIHNFIMSLPKGYNTILKENATDISGGQKQLISLARTLLSKSEILLFDEVTSSLDPNTTKSVIKLLKKLKKDHTVVMITHKPSLMKIADEIIVVNDGKIVGKGKHRKLLLNNKLYQALHK